MQSIEQQFGIELPLYGKIFYEVIVMSEREKTLGCLLH